MAPGSLKSLRLALMAVFLAGAPATHAAMYKWIDEEGSVTYSNQPPSDPAKAKELTRIEDAPPLAKPDAAIVKPEAPAAPKPESVVVQPETPAPKPETVTATPEAPAPMPETVTARPEPPAVKPEVVIVKPQAPGASPEIIMVNPAPEPETPRRVIPRPTHTEAVQDPCLTSSDRNCPQKNASHYSRYGGYSTTPGPPAVQPGIPAATGASSGAGAGGSVAGGKSTVAPPNWVAPVSPTTTSTKAKTKKSTTAIR